MKKRNALLLALFLCLALVLPCALAEDAYAPGQQARSLIGAALDAGQVVGGETHLSFQMDNTLMGDDDESRAQLDAVMETINGISLAGGFGKLEDGYRVELGGSYTAPSGDNVFVTAAANLTADGVSLESNLIEGERLSIRWETLLKLFGLTDAEASQLLSLRDVDWDSAMSELSAAIAQAAEEFGKLAEPYLATLSDFVATLDIQQRDNVAAEDGYPAVDHEISVTCTAEDLGRLIHTLADQMEQDDALLPYLEQLIANADVTFTDMDGEVVYVSDTEEFFAGMRDFADAAMSVDMSTGILVGYNDDGLPFYFTAAQTLEDDTSAIFLQINPGETENTFVAALTTLEADANGSITDRADADLSLTLDPNDANVFSAAFNYQSAELNFNIAEASVATEANLPGYQTTFSMTIADSSSDAPMRAIYTGEGLNTLTAAGGEQSTFSMTADIYDEDGDPVTISAEGGNLVEPKDGYLAGRLYMNENVDFYGLPFSFGFDTAVSSWDYDAAETAALAETVFETATGEELTALQSRASANLQQKLFELLSLVPSELLLEMFSE